MLVSKTPFRISFFGGGTDFPEFYREHGGSVISTTIDKYCHIFCRELPPFFSHKYRFVYSSIELLNEISDIQHPSIRHVLAWTQLRGGLELHHIGDLPARSGMGSSSSFTVGLLNVIRAHQNNSYDQPGQLAYDGIYVEQKLIGETVGSQDQTAVAFGGTNLITFNTDMTIDVKPLCLSIDFQRSLNNSLILFYLGTQRLSGEIEKSKLKRDNKVELQEIYSLVPEALRLLQKPTFDAREFGRLLHETWSLKRKFSSRVSNVFIDEMYAAARDEGAYGGKILGAGGGGFFLVVAEQRYHARIKKRLNKLLSVPIEINSPGSQVFNVKTEM